MLCLTGSSDQLCEIAGPMLLTFTVFQGKLVM